MYVSSINDLGNHVDRHIDLWVHNVTFLKEEFLFDTNRNSFLEFSWTFVIIIIIDCWYLDIFYVHNLLSNLFDQVMTESAFFEVFHFRKKCFALGLWTRTTTCTDLCPCPCRQLPAACCPSRCCRTCRGCHDSPCSSRKPRAPSCTSVKHTWITATLCVFLFFLPITLTCLYCSKGFWPEQKISTAHTNHIKKESEIAWEFGGETIWSSVTGFNFRPHYNP